MRDEYYLVPDNTCGQAAQGGGPAGDGTGLEQGRLLELREALRDFDSGRQNSKHCH